MSSKGLNGSQKHNSGQFKILHELLVTICEINNSISMHNLMDGHPTTLSALFHFCHFKWTSLFILFIFYFF